MKPVTPPERVPGAHLAITGHNTPASWITAADATGQGRGNPYAELDGPSRTIIVEPIRTPAPAPREPDYEPAPEPVKAPEEVPA